ncbi:MAG: GC-type dockerin domain-anchored protein [Phycisphaerales bacterium]|nr:GC-type dockerin domain-anchored protein [Phycisphaerales bacterium]
MFYKQWPDVENPNEVLYQDVQRFEQTAGVLINLAHDPNALPGPSEWDSLDPESPIYSDPLRAWTGFVRVGDPWVEPARMITLAPSAPIATNPQPDIVLDVFHDPLGMVLPTQPPLVPMYPPTYRRHSWVLSGLLNRVELRMGGAVGVYPYYLHRDDSSPTLDVYAQPNDPYSYHYLPAHVWVARWPLLNGTTDLSQDEWGGPVLPPIRLRFYGPLAQSVGTPSAITYPDLPVTIWERVRVNGELIWKKLDLRDPVSGATGNNFFDYRIENCDLLLGPRCLQPTRPGVYKVTLHDPVSDATDSPPREPTNSLLCSTFTIAGVEPESTLAQPTPFTWYIRLYSNCPDVGMVGGVIGSDGVLDNNDFVAFIDLFFEQDPRADVGAVGGEEKSDGLFDNNDWIVFIDLFFRAGADPAVLAALCATVYTNCSGDSPPPVGEGVGSGNGMVGGDAGGGGQSMMQGGGPEPAADRTVGIRAVLQQMIASEPPGPRRSQLQQMLDALPAPPGGN